jgi:ASC-1-like (ASCH) protein
MTYHSKIFQIFREVDLEYDYKISWDEVEQIKSYESFNFILRNFSLQAIFCSIQCNVSQTVFLISLMPDN